jgi:hypothetical protein
MKKLRLSVFLTIAFTFILQSALTQQLGIRSGLNYAKLKFTGSTDSDLKNALMAYRQTTVYGGFLNFKIVPLVSLQIEGNYDPRGYKSEVPSYSGEGIFEGEEYVGIDYLTVPVLARVKLLVFYLEAGPYAGFLLKARHVQTGTITIANTSGFETNDYFAEEDIKDELKNIDYGVIVGGGLSFKLGPVEISGGARYNAGFANILKENESLTEAKNSVMGVYAGLGLRF